jgi:Family of unknown function (DUF6029)
VRLRPAAFPVAALLLLTGARASALEVENVGGKPLVIDITNTAVLAYHFNNRNDSDLNPPTQVDDNYGEFLDRLNVQASWWRLRLGFRLDTALYFNTLDRQGIAGLVKDQTPYIDANATKNNPPAALAADATNNLIAELHSRFLRAIYPSKLFVGYDQKGLEVTVGDFYVQLGRGLVFSVRKIDELAIDTTVRGVKAATDTQMGDLQFDTMLFAGQMNPLRVDEASGRRLNGAGSPLFFGFPGAGPMEQYDVRTAPGQVIEQILPGQPSYYEDAAAGGKVEMTTPWYSLGVNAAGLYRKHADFSSTDPSKEHDRILNYSGTLNVPSILKHGDLYVEVARQAMRDGHLAQGGGSVQPDLDGFAAYASASITGGPVSISLEGKHYRNFFPLSSNIDITTPGFSAPEFSLVTYSQPPTAEPIYTEVVSGGSPNVCNTGGRARIDYRFNREASLYAWVGRYTSWSEVPGQDLSHGCVIAASVRDSTGHVNAVETDIWDAASGVDLGFEKGATHIKAWVGVRTSDTAVPELTQGEAEPITAFYREGYLRYDMIFHLKGPFSLQFQGFHRHRWEPVSFTKPWNEGENYTALQWSPHLSAVFGYEYFAKDGCEPSRYQTLSSPARAQSNFCNYVSGGLQWRSGSTWAENPRKKYVAQLFDAVNLFVGQRRGAIRCVNGSCRQFQPFEGARLEVTSRF